MEIPQAFEDSYNDQSLPVPIQTFMWHQISPFIRPKLGKAHEAACMFCQHAPGHHELKEACKVFERVLVQNLLNGLSPVVSNAIKSIPRWRFVQAAFPHVMHCTATLLHNRKDTNLQTLGPTETKLLYILQWIILSANEECADLDKEQRVYHASPFYYLFSIPAVSLFIYLFAPLCHLIKEPDLHAGRLESGISLWQGLWEYRHPDSPVFKALVKPKARPLWDQALHSGAHDASQAGNVFLGSRPASDDIFGHPSEPSPPFPPSASAGTPSAPPAPAGAASTPTSAAAAAAPSATAPAAAKPDEEMAVQWVSSPKDTSFPETIPEESSSTEEEHVVIFRLPSLPESEGMRENSIFTADASMFRASRPAKPSAPILDHVTIVKETRGVRGKHGQRVGSLDRDKSDSKEEPHPPKAAKPGPPPVTTKLSAAPSVSAQSASTSAGEPPRMNLSAATFLDVAVLRCLFIPQWQEEGVFWALQFLYHRLRDIADERGHQQQPRRRSNSLPIPKIEVSLYQSPEQKKRGTDSTGDSESKELIPMPDEKEKTSFLADSSHSHFSFSFRRKSSGGEGESGLSHFRRASEKVKKKMKMADLRAFVETKLLSKSEKTLEKIGRDEAKPLDEQRALAAKECHSSLDAGDDELSRPGSAQGSPTMMPASNLVKGKSMPSLSCLLDEMNGGGYMGELQAELQAERHRKRLPGAQSHSIPNPIITVTEHTPTPSPDFLRKQSWQGSVDSQLDLLSLQGQNQGQERKPSLSRSLTDSNITYQGDELQEAHGATCYITKEGDLDYQVVLKAVHAASSRESPSCTLRVCEVILNLLELLVDLGVLKPPAEPTPAKDKEAAGAAPATSAAPAAPGVSGGGGPAAPQGVGTADHDSQNSDPDSAGKGSDGKKGPDRFNTAHCLMLNTVLRVLRHLGCPYGCEEGQRGAPADFLRSQGQSLMARLQRSAPRQFAAFLRQMVKLQSLQDVMDLFHAYVGFCVDPSTLLSPLTDQKRSCSKSPDVASQGGYATNFGAGLSGGGGGRGVEGHIVSAVFKALVTRLVKSAKELKSTENLALFCDVRRLMTYVKEAHGGVFRRVALSGLLDCASRPNRREPAAQTTRVIKHINQSEMEQPELGSFIVEGNKKMLLKKRSTSSTCAVSGAQSLLETDVSEEGPTKASQSPLGPLRRKPHTLTPRHSERNIGGIAEGLSAMGGFGMAPGGMLARDKKEERFKIGGLVSWFRRDFNRTDSMESVEVTGSESEGLSALVRQASLHRSLSRGIAPPPQRSTNVLVKARKRVEDHFTKLGFGKGKKKDGSLEDTQGSYMSRRSSVDLGDHSRESEFVVFKERKLVAVEPVRLGMARLSFLLETCQPGSVPDSHLLAAVLDLPHAPVVARASMLLECCYFVHCCNKGQWPAWMKHNLSMFRPSGPLPRDPKACGGGLGGPGLAAGLGLPTGLRRTHLLQRAAGKMFSQWAEAVGARLEELMLADRKQYPSVVGMVLDENKHKELLMQDEEEDFLDEASVNLYGLESPMALRLVACMLLMEITAFMRETFQTLPKASRSSQRGDRPPPWERVYTGLAGQSNANRRWSMALSSMGHSQASAQSLQSIAGDQGAGQPERKISFVLHEPDNGSEGSSKSTVTTQGEDGVEEKKRRLGSHSQSSGQPGPAAAGGGGGGGSSGPSRPHLLRRGTTANASGSFKRRSLKLRRHTKEAKEILEYDLANTVKRADSIQSRRKVSSLSDRSDTSEQGGGGEVSGEESPGILSDDQPPESPSDSNDTDDTLTHLPWLKVLVQISSSFNFYCSHQQFCHPFCYRRHMRACSRLIKSVRKVYGEEFGMMASAESESDKREDGKKEGRGRGRKVSDQTSTQASPIRRKESDNKRDKIRDVDSQAGRSATRDSTRDLADLELDGAAALPGKGNGGEDKAKEVPPILKYLKHQVRDVFHAPLATLVKGAVVMTEDQFIEILPVAWELLLESNQEVAAAASSLFILAAVKAPGTASDIMRHGLHHADPAVRIKSILRFQVLWKLRYQVWPRMEEGAQVTFKVPPPGIEFTLPSPKIGIESLPVVDPPWAPQVTSKVEEVTISQESHRVLVSGTKTRKKQQTELVKLALQAQENKRREERENFLITTIPVTVQAAYEPSLYHAVEDHEDADDEPDQLQARNTSHLIHSAHSLFPSCLCSAVIQIISLLDDAAVSPDGNAVYEVAYQTIWNCLVEDSALFLRYVLERLTRDRQDEMFKLLRHLIRFIPKLPQQAAFALYNYIIGYVMFYVRSPQEDGQRLIGTALSILWMVVHSVHGIMFKDLKQILRKEQCDASILLTANVPSAKKIVVHGPQDPEQGGIPSQFPVQEDTQFWMILKEALDFFGIDESKHKEFFLIDHKTHQIHNPSSYVRDFYFFKRSQYPQLELVYMKPDEAFAALQQQELMHKLVEIGKVLLTWAILKNVDMVVQRVVFLHEELMKLPSFPRKALEADLDLYKGGEIGKELLGLDVLHKFMWVRLIARMFEAMAGNFAYSGDIHLLLNVLNGAVILHSEDACILRYVMATYINAAYNFRNIFCSNGYLMVIPTLLQLYSSHQTNTLVTRTVEYTVKQFYLMNRKPFILQMFGSVSAILDTDECGQYGDAHKVRASDLFNLLLSLETPSPDPLNIAELVHEEKPLKPIDFCYHDEDEMVNVLDCISLCVMVVAYAADSLRGRQMLIILNAILPCYMQQIQLPTYNKDGKTEKEIINQLAVAIKTMVNNCEALAKHYTGPQKSSPEHKGSSQRNYSRGPYSPAAEYEDDSHSKYISDHNKSKMNYDRDMEDSEVLRNEYRRPRDILLYMVAEFLTKCTTRLAELNKKPGGDGKAVELLDTRAHIRLSEVALSLLKVSPYDPDTMSCKGLQRYMTEVLPHADWSNETMRPALIQLVRRLDKTFGKIHKKASIRRLTDWEAAAGLLRGVYEAMFRFKFIVHFANLKSLLNTCQSLIVGEPQPLGMLETFSQSTSALLNKVPPPQFCSMVVRLIALQIVVIGETASLENNVCGGSSTFATPDKTEVMLMNVLIPLCIRVGSGRKDVAPLRQADISFILTVVLNAMSPPATKTAPVTAQTIKAVSEMRTGSLTGSHGDSKKQTPAKVPRSLYQVSFLALKILMVCFGRELAPDWPRMARTLRDNVRHKEAGCVFWNFLDFVVTQRTPLFVLLLPFIGHKLSQPPTSDSERHSMFVIREKLRGLSLPLAKSRSALLMELAHEIKELKEELEDRRYNEQVMDRHIAVETTANTRHHRPSIIELFTGATHFEQQRNVHRESVCSVASSNKAQLKEEETAKQAAQPGEPLSPASPGDDDSGDTSRPRLQRSKAQSRKTFRLRKSRKNRPESKDPQKQLSADAALTPRDKELGLGSESELLKLTRHMSARSARGSLRRPTETAELSLESETSGLGRVRHHSTLALQHAPPATPGAPAPAPAPHPTTRQARLGSIGEQRSPRLPPHAAPLARPFTTPPSLSEPRSDEESSFSCGLPPPLQPTPAPGLGVAGTGLGGGMPLGARLGPRGSCGPYNSDLSHDEDSNMSNMSVTSSTSGYRESCSLLMMAMDSPPDGASTSSSSSSLSLLGIISRRWKRRLRGHSTAIRTAIIRRDSTMLRGGGGGGGGGLMQVGAALGSALSTSSTTVAGDPSSAEHSPEHSSTTTGTADGETTALLGHSHSHSHSHSQHSLLEGFDRQDEDTLI
ncbi:hypothetical protein ONE63_008019 [Megalurothrips usitatus]|uniref:Protein unc-80 homolog n=1 Tax=Megalurothrips usitatus TaxID=439358 RepID=A0AAV7XQE6_9NEOP|nr:hypothetical protein ONE63_008019 [Megalurothrips usitatus]